MPDRSGVGDPPEGCTCLLSHSFYANGPVIGFGPHEGELRWRVHIAAPDCPHHGDRVRTETTEDA